MTTEIAIMNKSAVALAADSAVTIPVTSTQGRRYKVLNTANKLFALSKYAPIGLMVYGNANLLGVPWETIVKAYREQLGKKRLSTVEDYCREFFAFLDGFDIGPHPQEQYLVDVAYNLFHNIKETLDKWVKQQMGADKSVTEGNIQQHLRDLITEQHKFFKKSGEGSVLSPSKRATLRGKYRARINEIMVDVFEKLPLSQHSKTQLFDIVINAASIGPPNQSGIVIAGFGEKEIFPSCHDFNVAAVFAGKTIKQDKNKLLIDHDMAARIIPFAQSDEVHAFMSGVGPKLSEFLSSKFRDIMTKKLPDGLTHIAVDELGLTDTQRQILSKMASEMCKGACDQAFQEFDMMKQEDYVNPVMQATQFLNKGELAAMAETLVNLVSFRKQVTMEDETVGGPIDVAVITKGDGLVWIKRKHYFDPTLNHHFFSNYFEKGQSDGESQK